jgi:hypothetical protein
MAAILLSVPGEAVEVDDLSCEGFGTFSLPPGMTQEEADRLVREADEQRRKEREG